MPDEQTIAMIAAGLGVAGTVAIIVLGALGVGALRDIRDQRRDNNESR